VNQALVTGIYTIFMTDTESKTRYYMVGDEKLFVAYFQNHRCWIQTSIIITPTFPINIVQFPIWDSP